MVCNNDMTDKEKKLKINTFILIVITDKSVQIIEDIN